MTGKGMQIGKPKLKDDILRMKKDKHSFVVSLQKKFRNKLLLIHNYRSRHPQEIKVWMGALLKVLMA